MKRISHVSLCLLALFVTATSFATEPSAADEAVPSETIEAASADVNDEEPSVEPTAASLADLPGLPMTAAGFPPLINYCPDSCTTTNLTYVGYKDCYIGQYPYSCLVYRDNSTRRECAWQCSGY